MSCGVILKWFRDMMAFRQNNGENVVWILKNLPFQSVPILLRAGKINPKKVMSRNLV